MIFSSEMRHHRSIGLRRRRSRELTPGTSGRGILRDPRGALGVSDGEEVLVLTERREPAVVGRTGVSWGTEPEREVDEVAGERVSGSGLLRGMMRGLGAVEGLWLAVRLWA